jgi:hypothetical protein
MFEKAGRNDPCPCGSGQKFKKCCLPRQEALLERLGARRQLETLSGRKAVEWLNDAHEKEADAAIESAFFGFVEKAERERLDHLPQGLQQRIGLNLQDWVLNEASLELDGQRRPVRELIQAEAGEKLERRELDCLAAMRTHPLRLYEVRSVKPGEGIALQDLLDATREPVWVIERTASRKLAEGDVFATRLLSREDDGFVMSGAVYPFTRDGGLACLGEIRGELGPGPTDTEVAREIASRHIVRSWLQDLVKRGAAAPDAGPAEDGAAA